MHLLCHGWGAEMTLLWASNARVFALSQCIRGVLALRGWALFPFMLANGAAWLLKVVPAVSKW
jgi:hypothetical protein